MFQLSFIKLSATIVKTKDDRKMHLCVSHLENVVIRNPVPRSLKWPLHGLLQRLLTLTRGQGGQSKQPPKIRA